MGVILHHGFESRPLRFLPGPATIPVSISPTIPDRTELAGKTLQLDIKLAVAYAASTGPFGFENAKTTCEYKTDVLLASPHAGRDYRVLWWGGLVSGGVLVLLTSYVLRRLAIREKRNALPSRVIPIQDDELPEVEAAE